MAWNQCFAWVACGHQCHEAIMFIFFARLLGEHCKSKRILQSNIFLFPTTFRTIVTDGRIIPIVILCNCSSLFCYNLAGRFSKPFAQKNLASCPNFYERVEKKLQQHRPSWHMKVARYSFSGSIPSLSINYVAINKHLEKLRPQLY